MLELVLATLTSIGVGLPTTVEATGRAAIPELPESVVDVPKEDLVASAHESARRAAEDEIRTTALAQCIDALPPSGRAALSNLERVFERWARARILRSIVLDHAEVIEESLSDDEVLIRLRAGVELAPVQKAVEEWLEVLDPAGKLTLVVLARDIRWGNAGEEVNAGQLEAQLIHDLNEWGFRVVAPVLRGAAVPRKGQAFLRWLDDRRAVAALAQRSEAHGAVVGALEIDTETLDERASEVLRGQKRLTARFRLRLVTGSGRVLNEANFRRRELGSSLESGLRRLFGRRGVSESAEWIGFLRSMSSWRKVKEHDEGEAPPAAIGETNTAPR